MTSVTMKNVKRWRQFAGIGILGLFINPITVLAAAQYSSPNYQTNEVFFGSGGELKLTSPNYQGQASVGELGVGNSSSAHYQAQAGFNTSDTPVLELNVTGGTFDLGTLDSTTTATAATTFSVRSYLSSGYVVELAGTPPVDAGGGHVLQALSSPTASSVGTEQFGVNLVANTSPSVGTNPQQVPDSSFSFGQPTAAYATTNKFKFVVGDPIAQSNSSSGETDYALSMIANVSSTTNITPAGTYTGSLSLIAVPTF